MSWKPITPVTIGHEDTWKIGPQWQPIETAPKDSDIMVWVEDGEYSQIDIVRWEEYYPDGFYWAHARCADGLHVGGNVTHWMPLPDPPERV